MVPDSTLHRFLEVEFVRFKAFSKFTLKLGAFSVLVGPNNAGKSTILTAFRILAAAMRKAESRKAERVQGPRGSELGHRIDISAISVAEENIFYNYDEEEAASVEFSISNGNILTLYFPERGACTLLLDAKGKSCDTPRDFKKEFNCPIGFVPILGPLEHNEILYEREAARLALYNFRAARNFRNIWHHFPEKFEEFREEIQRTWPGMDVGRPEVDRTHEKPRLFMFCPEERRPREIAWSGFGFQVWCQMLTHVIQSSDASLFLIDEPDIYLHSDLQRQLLSILRNLGPDILIATHSVEIVSEAETEEIVVINKKKPRSQRIKNQGDLAQVFESLGSNVNPILTQLAKTKRALFLEGKDFQILGRFARRLGNSRVASRGDFGVIQIEGFNPERAKTIKRGMEMTLGVEVTSACILDRDFRSAPECAHISNGLKDFCSISRIHYCKEIENFLLVPSAIDRAIQNKLRDRANRGGAFVKFEPMAKAILEKFSEDKKNYVMSQYLAKRRFFEREIGSTVHETQLTEDEISYFEHRWSIPEDRLWMVPGKEALSVLNFEIQKKFQLAVTPASIIESMSLEEVPKEMRELINDLNRFIAM